MQAQWAPLIVWCRMAYGFNLPHKQELKDTPYRHSFEAIEKALRELRGGSSAYTPTNVSTDRSFDCDTVAVAELADVVATLIADLQAKGILS